MKCSNLEVVVHADQSLADGWHGSKISTPLHSILPDRIGIQLKVIGWGFLGWEEMAVRFHRVVKMQPSADVVTVVTSKDSFHSFNAKVCHAIQLIYGMYCWICQVVAVATLYLLLDSWKDRNIVKWNIFQQARATYTVKSLRTLAKLAKICNFWAFWPFCQILKRWFISYVSKHLVNFHE